RDTGAAGSRGHPRAIGGQPRGPPPPATDELLLRRRQQPPPPHPPRRGAGAHHPPSPRPPGRRHNPPAGAKSPPPRQPRHPAPARFNGLTTPKIAWYPGVLPGVVEGSLAPPANYQPKLPTVTAGSQKTKYYWICLRRPANPFAPVSASNPMLVVDALRFLYI